MERMVEDKRHQVIWARQAEETLGILKTKELDRFIAEQTRKELIVQDDIYTTRAARLRQV